MKRLNCLLAVFTLMVLCFGFSGCGDPDDDDGNGGGNSGLVGTWERSYGSGQTDILVFGRDASYQRNFHNGLYIETRKGSYSYNDATKILVINIKAVTGSNGAYTQTYIVHTLDVTKLVLIDTDGESYYYNRK